jgi:neopullulanase
LWTVGTYWLGKGIDGWRLDVPNEIDDDAFWKEFRRRCKAVNPEAYIVAELWGESKRWLQGDQFDGQMNYLFNRAAFGYFIGDKMDQTDTVRCGYGHMAPRNGREFAHDLNHMFNELYDPEIVMAQMNMLGSHDTPRTMTVASNDATAVNLMYLCALTVPGATNIYYGDEIGMIGRHDPDCRRAFPWDDEESWNTELQSDIRRYIALRHEKPALRRGDFSILEATDKVIVYQRRYEGQTAVIAFNNHSDWVTITCPDDFPAQLPEQLKIPTHGELFTAGKTLRLKGRTGRVWVN